jgi:site-specific recombinase XerD
MRTVTSARIGIGRYEPKNELIRIPNNFELPKSIDELTPEQIKFGVGINNLLAVRNIVVRASINFPDKVSQFLGTYSDKESTASSYRTGINKYILFCKETGIKPEYTKFETAREFKSYLEKNNFSNKTINNYTTAIRLLFQFIIDNDELAESMKNPFYQKKLHKNGTVLKKEKELLTYEEELKVLNWFKNNNEYLYNTLYYQLNFGVRIDTFSKITNVKNGQAYYVSKGKECLTPMKINGDKRKFETLMKEWKAQGTHSLCVMVNRWLKMALNELNIDKHITSHCFRHTFVQELSELGVDDVSLSRLVNHRNLSSKDAYLTSKKQESNNWLGLSELRKHKKNKQ